MEKRESVRERQGERGGWGVNMVGRRGRKQEGERQGGKEGECARETERERGGESGGVRKGGKEGESV